MHSTLQQAEQDWHEELYASRGPRDFVVPEEIRNRYLFPSKKPKFHLECFFSLVGDVKNKRVLVFGCGDDTTTILLALKGAEVWAFDIAEEAIRLQEQMALANGVQHRIHLMACAAEEFPFTANSFDLIAGAAILHHIPDHLPQLPPQLVHALDESGRALFVEPVVLSPTLGRVLGWLPGHQAISPGERQLTSDDLGHFAKHFHITPYYFCLISRLDRFILKGPLETAPRWKRAFIQAIHWIDSTALRVPVLKRFAGVVVLELSPRRQ